MKIYQNLQIYIALREHHQLPQDINHSKSLVFIMYTLLLYLQDGGIDTIIFRIIVCRHTHAHMVRIGKNQREDREKFTPQQCMSTHQIHTNTHTHRKKTITLNQLNGKRCLMMMLQLLLLIDVVTFLSPFFFVFIDLKKLIHKWTEFI